MWKKKKERKETDRERENGETERKWKGIKEYRTEGRNRKNETVLTVL